MELNFKPAAGGFVAEVDGYTCSIIAKAAGYKVHWEWAIISDSAASVADKASGKCGTSREAEMCILDYFRS